MMTKKRKVFIIGLDGARLDIVKKWVNEGRLPNIRRLMKKGVYGNLRTVFPPHSMLAWVSFMTGKNPGKHGIYNIQLQVPGTYKQIVPNSSNIHGRTFYEIASEKGMVVGSINIPVTYPPRKVNGVVVGCWLSPPFSKYAYPDEAYEEMKEIGYMIQPESVNKEDRNFIKSVYETTDKRIEAVKWFMQNYDWNLTAFLITETEHMHHNFAAFIDKEHPDYSDDQEEIVKKYYEYADKKIGELIKLAGTADIFIISDHGFGPSYGEIYLNNVLKKYGFFVEQKRFDPLRSLFRFLEVSGLANKVRDKIQIDVFKILPENIRDMVKEKRAEQISADWNKTKAYCTGILGDIRINLKGREPNGIVHQKDYEKVRNEIVRVLSEEEGIRGFINKIYKREEIFKGPSTKDAPDIYVEFKKCCTSSTKTPRGKLIGKRVDIGFHTMDGMIIACGPDIKSGMIKNANIMDIAPTVLHILGLHATKDMDGKVLKKIFRTESGLVGKRIRKIRDKRRKEVPMTTEDEEFIRERLKSLGYLS
jgi:predicted AlkP superfamily phosphohydrolase/phosphomutase